MESIVRHSFSERIAKLIRAMTVPPLMAAILVWILHIVRPESFMRRSGPGLMLLFLTILPALAYPLSGLIPRVRKAGRDGQRNLAFILSGIGYVCGFLYGLFGPCSKKELLIYGIYLISVILLLLFNKLLKIKASGHACSVTGPLVLACWFLGSSGTVVSLFVGAAIFWSSMKLKRHTMKELTLGSLLCVTAMILSYGLTSLLR